MIVALRMSVRAKLSSRIVLSLAGSIRLSRLRPLTLSVAVCDRQLLGGEKRNHPAARVGHNDLLLYAGRGISVRGRTVCLEREHHACLDLHWPIERDQARTVAPSD
jgi:hypothetical protein